jgi:hypothetical protein
MVMVTNDIFSFLFDDQQDSMVPGSADRKKEKKKIYI